MSYLLYKRLILSEYSEGLRVVLEWLEANIGPKKTNANIMKVMDGIKDDSWFQQFTKMQVFTEYRCGYGALAIIHTIGDGWEMYQAWCKSEITTEIQIFVRVVDTALAVKMKLELFCG